MESDQARGADSGAAAPGAAPSVLDPRQRFRVSIQEGRFGLTPIARYGRQPRLGDVLMPAGTDAHKRAEARLRELAGFPENTPASMPRVIQAALGHAGQIRDEGMAIEVRVAIGVLIGEEGDF